MPRRTFVTRTVASAAAVAFLASPAAAVAAPDPASDGGPAARPGSAAVQAARGTTDPADKITPAATRAFQAEDTTDFWLRFAGETDLSAAGGITSWSERGDYVYETLLAAAESSQKQAIDALEESGTEYTSYWATNSILVEDGSLDQATDLAADAQVLEVWPHDAARARGAGDDGRRRPERRRKLDVRHQGDQRRRHVGPGLHRRRRRGGRPGHGREPQPPGPVRAVPRRDVGRQLQLVRLHRGRPPPARVTTTGTAPTPWAPWWAPSPAG